VDPQAEEADLPEIKEEAELENEQTPLKEGEGSKI